MLVLGIDPGTRFLGWGLVRKQSSRLLHVDHGVIELDPKLSLPDRLVRIDLELGAVVRRHRPDVGSVETLFFHKDAQAAAKLGHARGVVLLRLAQEGVSVAEYAPARVKRTLVGTGQAEKRQVAMMVKTLLGLPAPPPSDAADALALAITHLRLEPLGRALGSSAEGSAAARLALLTRGRRRPSAADWHRLAAARRKATPKI
jgi:crossover junction endodeoxyribonuclease RuvC